MKTTIGIPILIVLLRLLSYGFSLTPFGHPPESIQSGNYGRPPKVKWWLKQCFIYFLGLLGMKLCVYFIFQICPWIVRVGDWALKWTEGNETVQIFFVMLFFPVVMNAIQYYIIDAFIKDQTPLDHEPVPGDDESDTMEDDDGQSRRRRSSEVEHDHRLDGVDEVEIAKDDADMRISEDRKGPAISDAPPTAKEDSRGLDEFHPPTEADASAGKGSGTPECTEGLLERDGDGVK